MALRFALVLLSTTASAAPTYASPSQQPASTITISPSTTKIVIAPGKTALNNFDIVNSSDAAYLMTASVSPYSVENDTYAPRFTQLPGTPDVTSWIHLKNPQATIRAHKVYTVNYSLDLPANTAPGGYYAVIFAQTTAVANATGGIMAHNRVGDVLYITVTGPVQTSGTVEGITLSHVYIDSGISIGMKVHNTGAIHFLSTTTTTVTNIAGKEVYSNSSAYYILPHTTRLVTTGWLPPSPIGVYNVQRSAVVAGVKQHLPDQWIVIIQPWLLQAAALAILLVVFFWNMKWLTRRFKKATNPRDDEKDISKRL